MIKVEDYTKEMLFIFFSQKTFILRVCGIIFVSSVLIALFWPPTYAAYGSFLLKGKELQKTPSAIEAMEFREQVLQNEDLASEVEVLIANSTIDNTLKYLRKKYPDKGYEKLDTTSVQAKLKTQILPVSNVIKVSYFAKSPDSAKELLDVLMNEYLSARMNVLNSVAAKDFFSDQVNQYENELNNKENTLHSLVGKTGVSNPEKQIESNILRIGILANTLNELENQVINKKYLIKQLEVSLGNNEVKTFSFINNSGTTGINNSSLSSLGISLVAVYAKSALVVKNYKEESEQYESVQRELKSLYKLMHKEVTDYKMAQVSELQSLEKQVETTQNKIAKLNESNVILHKQIIDTNKISRETGILTATLETFAKRREEASVNSIKSNVNLLYSVNIIDKAYSLADPVYPQKPITILLGLIVGFITGCSLGFIRSYLDHTFKSVLDVERYLAMPVLFSIDNYTTDTNIEKSK
jgi:uncharacterized protein involved in exopolysaccharide biosynthesis